jgi:anthranilate synthase / indole-3-glycerol phosphate synthase / phosphoribosylanthranilate isomerase
VAAEQGVKYTEAGAGILSVLTEPKWFKGSLQDMKDVRLATEALAASQGQTRPAVLRKDFVVEEYQLLEARAYGADTALLIVAILEVDRLHRLIAFARKWGMEPLVEVNTLAEMEIALDAGARVIGVNNRNLHTFQLDLGTTERVMGAAQQRGLSWDRRTGDILLAALSGISARADVERYERAGVAAVLIGETLMRAPDPAKAVRELIGLEAGGPVVGANVLIKVCGVTRPEDALAATRAGAGLVGTIFCKSKRRVTGAQAAAVVAAVRGFGERTTRVLPYQEAVPGAAALSPAWFEHWRKELLRVTRRTPLVVGVFQNNTVEEVAALVEESGVDLVQLHGEEPLVFASEVSRRTGVPCLKVLHVPHEGAQVSEVLAGLTAGADDSNGAGAGVGGVGGPVAILLDTSVGGQKGGSGTQFDWTLAAAVQAQGYPVIVAGGLLPSNVEAALKAARPFGVDVSGGVEASPGVKDHAKVTEFVGKTRAFKA